MSGNSWQIKARVIRKQDKKTYQNSKGSGQLFNIEILDNCESEMECTFFGNSVDKFYPYIQEQKIYSFSNGFVKPTNSRMSKNDFAITFDEKAEINELPDDQDIPVNKFSFELLSKIENLPKGAIVDIIGIVKDPGEISVISTKNGDRARRQLQIFDETQTVVEITLWGDKAEECGYQINQIIAAKNLSVNEFNNQKNLTTSWSSQFITSQQILMNLKEYQQLVQLNSEKNCITLEQIEQKAANELIDLNSKIYSDVIASIFYINPEGTLYYISCPNEKCKRKVIEDPSSNTYFCMNCNQSYETCKARYIFTAKLGDESGNLWATFYDNVGLQIIQAEADSIKELKENNMVDQLKEVLTDSWMKLYKLTIVSKLEVYNGEKRIKHAVIKVQILPDFASEIKNILEDIEQYELIKKQ